MLWPPHHLHLLNCQRQMICCDNKTCQAVTGSSPTSFLKQQVRDIRTHLQSANKMTSHHPTTWWNLFSYQCLVWPGYNLIFPYTTGKKKIQNRMHNGIIKKIKNDGHKVWVLILTAGTTWAQTNITPFTRSLFHIHFGLKRQTHKQKIIEHSDIQLPQNGIKQTTLY